MRSIVLVLGLICANHAHKRQVKSEQVRNIRCKKQSHRKSFVLTNSQLPAEVEPSPSNRRDEMQSSLIRLAMLLAAVNNPSVRTHVNVQHGNLQHRLYDMRGGAYPGMLQKLGGGLRAPFRLVSRPFRRHQNKEHDDRDDGPTLSPKALELAEALARLLAETDSDLDFESSAKLLLRYCENLAAQPDEPKFHRIHKHNGVFERHLGRWKAALECLTALGFQQSLTDDSVLEAADVSLPMLSEAIVIVQEELNLTEMRNSWPAPLQSMARDVCGVLRGDPKGRSLFSQLTAELQYERIPMLLADEESLNDVKLMLQEDPTVIGLLVEQLREMRENVTTSQANVASRVLAVGSAEEWYDLLMESKGLVVADFGAKWCGPCQEVRPLFEELSGKPEYADVTFVSIDVDELPVVAGDELISAYPTFKFYRDAAQEDIPVESADIVAVEEKIIALQEM